MLLAFGGGIWYNKSDTLADVPADREATREIRNDTREERL